MLSMCFVLCAFCGFYNKHPLSLASVIIYSCLSLLRTKLLDRLGAVTVLLEELDTPLVHHFTL